MIRYFQPLLFMLAGCREDQHIRQIEYLKAECEMLRRRVPKKRIFLNPDERAHLLKLGKELGPAIRQVITIVSYSTFRRWVRNEKGHKRKGRPRLAAMIRELVVKLVKESGWGYTRILGELRKLKVGPISRQSIKNILIENGFEPGPKRGKGTWSEFIEIHKDTRAVAAFAALSLLISHSTSLICRSIDSQSYWCRSIVSYCSVSDLRFASFLYPAPLEE